MQPGNATNSPMRPARSLKIAALAALAILALSATIAVADTDRATYVATVEPICKTNSNANARILKGVRQDGPEGQAEARRRQVPSAPAPP